MKFTIHAIIQIVVLACAMLILIVGCVGPRGFPGKQGKQGMQGLQGTQGCRGEVGPQGLQGAAGTQGAPGKDGRDGKDGMDGSNGTNGRDGRDGTNGRDGRDGRDGTTTVTEKKPADGDRDIADVGGRLTAEEKRMADVEKRLADVEKKATDEPAYMVALHGVFVALAVWIIQQIWAYAARRYNLIKSIALDLGHRMANALLTYKHLEAWKVEMDAWHNSLSASLGTTPPARPLPQLKSFSEEHVLYRNVQPMLIECLWGEEVQRVRETYRWLERIESRVDRIRAQYELLKQSVIDTATPSVRLKRTSEYVKESIERQIIRYRYDLEGLLRDEKKKEQKNEAFLSIDAIQAGDNSTFAGGELDALQSWAHDMFIPCWSAYGTQAIAPSILVSFLALLGILSRSVINGPTELLLWTTWSVLFLAWLFWAYYTNVGIRLRPLSFRHRWLPIRN